MKMATRKNIHNLSKGLPNPGFMQEKGTKRGFSKKGLARIKKKIHNMSQGPSNPECTQEKVQSGDFLKKPLQELKKYFCFWFK